MQWTPVLKLPSGKDKNSENICCKSQLTFCRQNSSSLDLFYFLYFTCWLADSGSYSSKIRKTIFSRLWEEQPAFRLFLGTYLPLIEARCSGTWPCVMVWLFSERIKVEVAEGGRVRVFPGNRWSLLQLPLLLIWLHLSKLLVRTPLSQFANTRQ